MCSAEVADDGASISVPVGPFLVLIDGQSGTGKSTLATQLLDAWPGAVQPTLVRMDDLYPGWSGLAAASLAVQRDLVGPYTAAASTMPHWARWDWAGGHPTETITVDPRLPLIVEGCGCLTRQNAARADLRIWLTASDPVRKSRALERDAGGFDDFWDLWQGQMDAFTARERPADSADLILDTEWSPPALSDGPGGRSTRGRELLAALAWTL